MRKYWFAILQAAVSVLLIYKLFHNAGFRAEISQVLSSAEPHWLLMGLGSALVTEAFCAVRWWLMLRIFGTPISLGRAFLYCGAGLFFSLGLPGMGGGDAFRILYIARLYPNRKMQAATSVLVDRLCGLVALILAFALTASFQYRLFASNPHTHAMLRSCAIMLAVVVFLLFVWWLTTIPRINALRTPKLIEPMRYRFDRFGSFFKELARHPRLLAVAMLVSVIALAAHFTTYFMSAKAFALPVGLPEIFTVMPLVDTLILLPISLYGVGVRENLFELLLGGLFGLSQGAATLTSLGGFVLQASVALLGAASVPWAKSEQPADPLTPTKPAADPSFP